MNTVYLSYGAVNAWSLNNSSRTRHDKFSTGGVIARPILLFHHVNLENIDTKSSVTTSKLTQIECSGL
ncbi:hypothetical protein L914_02559 [Phytophthora nicotianae]|uniref:Uncharacterized protein n=1 Tax=Phytophthora nicotianae TaxID=4792 RepID=W2P1C4_PHYNI|nr:hypothetical protein L914_02559 [Phytophthora nicotianae]